MNIKTFFDFSSGIGGGRYGLEKCGLRCVGSSDTSKLSNITYDLLFPHKKDHQYGNLRRLVNKPLPKFDILIAGFPCQSFSVIGRQTGTNDKRGQIIYDLIEIMKVNRPKFAILENVKGLISHDKGKTFRDILNRLEEINYCVTYKILNSIDFGVPHMRQRVYIVAVNNELNLDINEFEWPEPMERVAIKRFLRPNNNFMSAEDFEWFSTRYLFNDENKGKYNLEDILRKNYLIVDTRMSDLRLYENRMPTLRAHRDGIYYVYKKRLCYLTGSEALRFQGFTGHKIKNVTNIVSNRNLLKQAGNAMTANVITGIGWSILNFSEGKYGHDMARK